ncbi:MAG: benzoyl-CoA reductase subunit D [Deltaproteobacteria bacterium]|nr:benzoyl-CoA reductase subunit D [Deltaproteobacteria bacterium]
MTITAGLDIGSGSVKAVVMSVEGDKEKLLSHVVARIRKRTVPAVVDEVFSAAVEAAGLESLDYVATTGEGEDVPFATGHFYGMTTHARGGLFLDPQARAVLDVGALHGRAVLIDERGKVLNYKMTSQCASGSGQFLENIARYLGVSQAEIGDLSLSADDPEQCSSICAVLAETDVINMVSRGISTPNILRGIHDSMAGRFARLLRSVHADGVVLVTGGLATDAGLIAALQHALDQDTRRTSKLTAKGHSLSIFAGAIGAALWGAYRHSKLDLGGAAWTKNAPTWTSQYAH